MSSPMHGLPQHSPGRVAKLTTVSVRFVASARANAATPTSLIEVFDNDRSLSVRLAMSASANAAAPVAPIPLSL